MAMQVAGLLVLSPFGRLAMVAWHAALGKGERRAGQPRGRAAPLRARWIASRGRPAASKPSRYPGPYCEKAPSWRSMAIAGMATAHQTALLLIRHGDLSRMEVADTLGRRWPSCVVGDLGTASPSWTMPDADAIELARIRRGVEPLRVLVLGRRSAVSMPLPAEPMPTLF